MPYLMFIAVCVIWGSSFILMKLARPVFGPMSVGMWRALGGALALWLGWRLTRHVVRWHLTRGQRLRLAVPVVLGMACPWVVQPHLIGKHNHSALFGMMVGLVPLMTLIVSIPMLGVYPKVRQVVGVGVGLGCLGVLLGVGHDLGVPWQDVALATTVPLAYAISNTYLKRVFADTDPVALTMITLALAGGVLVPLAGIEWAGSPRADGAMRGQLSLAVAALVVLGVVGTGLATLMFIRLVQTRGPLFAGMVTYFVPVGALFWGAVHGERISGGQVLALGGILISVALVQWPTGATGSEKR